MLRIAVPRPSTYTRIHQIRASGRSGRKTSDVLGALHAYGTLHTKNDTVRVLCGCRIMTLFDETPSPSTWDFFILETYPNARDRVESYTEKYNTLRLQHVPIAGISLCLHHTVALSCSSMVVLCELSWRTIPPIGLSLTPGREIETRPRCSRI